MSIQGDNLNMQPGAEIAAEFLQQLEAYFRAVEDWEQAYGKFYRLSMPNQVSADLQPHYQRFEAAKQGLKRILPQAKALCHRYGIKENWSGLLVIQLESRTPQEGITPIIGRTERSRATTALTELELALLTGETNPERPRRKRSFLDILQDLF